MRCLLCAQRALWAARCIRIQPMKSQAASTSFLFISFSICRQSSWLLESGSARNSRISWRAGTKFTLGIWGWRGLAIGAGEQASSIGGVVESGAIRGERCDASEFITKRAPRPEAARVPRALPVRILSHERARPRRKSNLSPIDAPEVARFAQDGLKRVVKTAKVF